MGLRGAIYRVYETRLARKLHGAPVPRHVGVIVDGNRRWARSVGASSAQGHRKGADKIVELLEWCDEAGVEVVTLWLLSTDNLSRPPGELQALLAIIENTIHEIAATNSNWRVNPMGALDLIPEHTAVVLKEVADATADRTGLMVNAAVGYGGRREIADAVRSLLSDHLARGTSLEDVVATLDVEHIGEHMYTRGQPDPDLVIRTSGEVRLSGFLLWQTAHSEFYFCDAYWPDFRHVDFLRALRSYAQRQRRFGV